MIHVRYKHTSQCFLFVEMREGTYETYISINEQTKEERHKRCALEAFVDFDRRSVEFSDATETQPVQIPFPAHSVEWYKALALSCGPYSNDQWSTDISLGISLLEREDLRQDARVAAHVAAVATWHPCPKKHLRWDKDRSRP